MSGIAPQIEWYIARDGSRHGPISEVELRKFVELGHLKPTDLVWCANFTEWQLAAQVFGAEIGQPRQPAQAPAQAPAHAPASASTQASTQGSTLAPQPVVQPARAPATAAVTAATAPAPVQSNPQLTPTAAAAQPSTSMKSGPATAAAPANGDDAAWASAMREILEQPATKPAGGGQISGHPVAGHPVAGQGQSTPSFRQAGPGRNEPGRDFQPLGLQPSSRAEAYSPAAYAPVGYPPKQAETRGEASRGPGYDRDGYDRDGYPEAPRARRDWIGMTAVTGAVLLILGGLGWVGWQNRSLFNGAAAIGSAIKATVSTGPSAETFRNSPYEAPGETADVIDAALQRTAIWRVLKRDHPEWYGERLTDVARMRAEKRDEKTISRFLADVIVTLRRRNAQTALQSSQDHLRGMAKMFGENLRQLASRDGSTCFAFITYGEANPMSLDLSRRPEFAEPLQKQMIAIFEAIANGKANRFVHPNTQRNDYDLLTKELTTRGWTPTDLAIFSDPQRLSSSPPEKVCTLVQEWFATHLAITDKELQTRLLAESLKPLVGG